MVAPDVVTAEAANPDGTWQAGGVQLDVKVPKVVGRGVVATDKA
jgi:hypothetical protein